MPLSALLNDHRETTPVLHTSPLALRLFRFAPEGCCTMGLFKLKSALLDAFDSGPREIRTLDLLNAIETRSQLRYGPIINLLILGPLALPIPQKGASCAMGPFSIIVPRALCAAGHQVDLEGLEPSTSSVRLRRAPNCATGPFFQGDDDFT